MPRYAILMGILCFFSSCFVVLGQPYSGNLVKNNGFEDGWQYWNKGGHAEMTWEISDSIAHSGKCCLHVHNASHLAPNVYGTISQKIKVKPNTKYVFSLWIKAESAHHIWFGGGKGWRLRKYCPHGSWDWKRFSVTYKTKPDESRFVFRINFDGYVGDAWIDDVCVQEYTEQAEMKNVRNTNAEINKGENYMQRLLKGYAELENKLWPLYVLIDRRCYYKHIPCEYERMNFEIIKRFVNYGRADISHGKLKRAEYVLKFIKELYGRTEERVKGYLAGTKKPLAVSRYRTGKIEIKDYGFIADTMFPASYEKIRRNVLFVGFGHFEQVRRDLPVLSRFGLNIIQVEIGPNRGIINRPRNSDEEFYVDTRPIKDDIVHVLKEAEINNVAVCLLLSPHYFPNWLLERNPKLKNNNGFLKYNINEPIAKRVMKAYLQALIPLVKDYKSLHSLCLSNEPNFHKPGREAYKKLWVAYIKKLYGGEIGKLNETYKTNYVSFDDVPIANNEEKFGPAAYYDWVIFNSEQFADWHRWMKDIIRKIAPEIPVHVKIRLHCTFDPLIVKEGVDPELFSELSDINGCDCSCYYDDKNILPAYVKEMCVYDMASSFRQAPIFNSEDHIINDSDKGHYGGMRPKHVRMVLWQGAIHRRSASTIWLWERGTYELFQYRPDCLLAVGRTALDLNRLYRQVTALQNIKPKVAILYSNPAFVHSLDVYRRALLMSYRALSLSGIAIGFISEKQVLSGKLDDYEIVFVPQTECVYPRTIKKLRDYVVNGGKVVVVTSDEKKTLIADEHKLPLNERIVQARNELIGRAKILNDDLYESVKKDLFELLKERNLINVVLIDKQTGELADGIEWRAVERDGRLLINIANYTMKDKTIRILQTGCKITQMKNLISDERVDGEVITISGLTPILVECRCVCKNTE